MTGMDILVICFVTIFGLYFIRRGEYNEKRAKAKTDLDEFEEKIS